jgi:hypothetical protein
MVPLHRGSSKHFHPVDGTSGGTSEKVWRYYQLTAAVENCFLLGQALKFRACVGDLAFILAINQIQSEKAACIT